jgi:hypothetical protein
MSDFQVILGNTMGALECGVMISNMLFGCVTMQVFIYYQNYPHDSWRLKTLVAVLWLLELSHTICIMHGIYVYTVTRHGQLDNWSIPPSFRISSCITCVISTVIQAFYTHRLSIFFKKLYFPVICWLLMAFDFVVLLTYLVTAWSGVVSWTLTIACIWGFYVTGGVDLFISTLLCYYLAKNRRSSAQANTISVLDRLIVMTIITGVIMAIVSGTIATLILTATRNPSNAWYSAALVCEGKVSSNLMLLSLNSRSIHRETLASGVRMSKSVSQALQSPH